MARTSLDLSENEGTKGYLASYDEEEARDRLRYVPRISIPRRSPDDSYAKTVFGSEGSGVSGFDAAVIPDAVKSQAGSLMNAGSENAVSRIRSAGQALGFKNATEIAFADAKAAQDAAEKEAAGKRTGDVLGTIGKIGGAAIGALALCDENFKQDIAPLEEVEVIDRLAVLALRVQAIRERT